MGQTSYDDMLLRFLRTHEDLATLTTQELRLLGIRDVAREKQLRAFIAAQGVLFPMAAPHGQYRQQSRGECFYQSIYLSINSQIEYVEGFAIQPKGHLLALRHAWCLEPAGGLVDITWEPRGLAYFGIKIPRDFVEWFWDERRGEASLSNYSLLGEYCDSLEDAGK